MWPFPKRTARQKEIRRTKAERRGAWYRRLPHGSTLAAGFSVAVVAAAAVAILNAGGEVLGYREGQVVPRAVTARVKLTIEDKERTEQLRRQARDSSPNYYKLNVALIDDIRGRLANALTLAKAHPDDADRLRQAAAENGVLLDEAGLAELRRLAAAEGGEQYQRIIDAVIAQLKNSPLVEPEPAGTRRITPEAYLYDPTVPRELRKLRTELLFSSDPAAAAKAVEQAVAVAPEPLRASLAASIKTLLTAGEAGQAVKPLYRFDTERSVRRAQLAYESVEPVARTYAVGEVLADAGPISADELALLRAEQAAYLASPQSRTAAWLRVIGRSLLILLVVFGVAAYMARYQPKVFANHFRRTVSMALLLLILGLTRLVFVSTGAPPQFAIGMMTLAAGLLAVVYADEAVFAICGALAVLTTVAVQESVLFFVGALIVAGTMVFNLRAVRNRGKIVLVGALAALVAFVTTTAVGFFDGQLTRYVLLTSSWAAGTTLMAGFVIEGVLPGIERLFRLSTGMTLLEWCDASKPLLRLMAAEAPGTYNHSMMVGTLAEAAAQAIGADGLLCRAGAYYHDIGKINKPEYFVENQTPGFSRHEKLSPAMSLLVIIGHVKDGIEMAKEYGLPASLHRFIPEHHGTTLVEYFYHAASQARRPEDPAISDTQFRYPGPKPQSRETAVVMLADGVEGAVRAMTEPTPNRIEGVVQEIIRKRLVDGQFDECDLTFRELAEIEKSLVKSLCSIYHARIVYPGKEEERKSAAS